MVAMFLFSLRSNVHANMKRKAISFDTKIEILNAVDEAMLSNN